MSKRYPTFSEQRREEQRKYEENKRAILEAAKRSPSAPVVGHDYDLAEELGGAEALWRFKQTAAAHHLDLTRERDFERCKLLFADPDKERTTDRSRSSPAAAAWGRCTSCSRPRPCRSCGSARRPRKP